MSDQPQPNRRRRWHVALAVVLLLGSAVAAAVIRTPSRSSAAAQEPLTTMSPSPSSPPAARESLRRLAATIVAVPADSATGYAFHHQRRWILDTTGTPAPYRPNTPAVVGIEIRRWEAADGSGLGIDVEIGPDFTLTGANPDHRSTDAEFAKGHTTRHTYAPGNQRSPIAEPLATDPAGLARQLAAADPMPDGPQATLRAVDALYTSHYVGLPTRRAVLEVLANLDGLSYRDGAADRLGRTGAAVSLTAHGVEYTLVFDTRTGHLLASEQRSVGAHEYLNVPHGLIRYYTLFIEQTRRSELS